jgi:hypothetical protein
LNNYTTNWTLPRELNKYAFDNKIKIEHEVPYYIPSVECEITLLICRNVLDLHGEWKKKHMHRIEYLKPICVREELLKCVEMALPKAEYIVECIYNRNYVDIFNALTRR